MDKGTQTRKFETVVDADPIETHKLFLDNCWWGKFPLLPKVPYLTAYMVLEPAKDEAGTGAKRLVPTGLHEQIHEAELGKFLEYSVVKKLYFPVTYHRGRVSFIEVAPHKTKVLWEINYTPLTWGLPILAFFWLIIRFFLWDFNREMPRLTKKA